MNMSSKLPIILAGLALTTLAACDDPLDYDLRRGRALNTSDAAINATEARPRPDARGVISYPGYQVAVAQRGDTVTTLANRIGANPAEVAKYNGLAPDQQLRNGEVLALKTRVTEPRGGPITPTVQPQRNVDISSVAGKAIDDAKPAQIQTTKLEPVPAAKPAAPSNAPSNAQPDRHKVKRGETAYSISRLYNVSVRSLAEWNGLDSEYHIREGQYLLIPVAKQAPPTKTAAKVTAPGEGSPTPLPPSASKPLPTKDTKPVAAAEKPKTTAAPDLGKSQSTGSKTKMATPVSGNIVRTYSKGRNEGIDIAAAAGSPVNAAQAGTVAAVTEDTNGIPIIVIKHGGDLLTVYSNVTKLSAKEGDKVQRGQKIAEARNDNSAVHFEIRKGFESVDPVPYIY